MNANCSDSTESNNTNICWLAYYIFIKYLILTHTCRNMEKKSMEIDESLLDDEDGDDITICGRESISSLFIRACSIGPEDVFEDQHCTSTPSSTAHTPFAQSGFPHAYYLARPLGTGCSQSAWAGWGRLQGKPVQAREGSATGPLRSRGTAGSWRCRTSTA